MSNKITLMGGGLSRELLRWVMPIATAVVAVLAISPILTPWRADAATSVGTIATVSGTVWVQPINSSHYYAADVGTKLYVGDLILPTVGSEVILGCRNGTRLPVPSGVPSGVTNICPLPLSEDWGK